MAAAAALAAQQVANAQAQLIRDAALQSSAQYNTAIKGSHEKLLVKPSPASLPPWTDFESFHSSLSGSLGAIDAFNGLIPQFSRQQAVGVQPVNLAALAAQVAAEVMIDFATYSKLNAADLAALTAHVLQLAQFT